MITTLDNPFDPFDNFSSWYQYDIGKGYNTCELLARMTPDTFGDTSMLMYDMFYEEAEKELLKLDLFGNYIQINKEDVIKMNLI